MTGRTPLLLRRALVATLLLALLLRAATIGWGMPLFDSLEGYYHPDESKVVDGAAGFPEHVLTNRDLRYPTLLAYATGILALPLGAMGFAGGEQRYLAVLVLVRCVVVLLGTLGVWLTFVLARRLFDAAHGVVAAGLLAVMLFHVQNSVWATTDVPSAVALTLFVLVGQRAWRADGSARARAASGAMFGALIATKYPGVIAAVAVPVWAFAARDPDGRFAWRRPGGLRRLTRDGVWFGLAAIATLLATVPGILVHPDAFLQSARSEAARVALFARPRTDPDTWWFVLQETARAFGWPLAVLSLCGLATLVRRNPALVAIVVVFYLACGGALFARYTILIAPIMTTAAARLALLGVRARPAVVHHVAFAGLAAVWCWSLGYTLAGLAVRMADTRTAAAHAIAEQLPRGTTVGLMTTLPDLALRGAALYKYPVVEPDAHPLRHVLEHPDVLVGSSRDMRLIADALTSGKMSATFELPADYPKWWDLRLSPTPQMFAFYAAMATSGEYELWREFPADSWVPIEFGPPTIQIFRRRQRQ